MQWLIHVNSISLRGRGWKGLFLSSEKRHKKTGHFVPVSRPPPRGTHCTMRFAVTNVFFQCGLLMLVICTPSSGSGAA